MPIYIDDELGVEYHVKQVRFPRSKRKRIRKKWSKQNKNFQSWTTQTPVAYKIGSVLVMNSLAMQKLKSELNPPSLIKHQ